MRASPRQAYSTQVWDLHGDALARMAKWPSGRGLGECVLISTWGIEAMTEELDDSDESDESDESDDFEQFVWWVESVGETNALVQAMDASDGCTFHEGLVPRPPYEWMNDFPEGYARYSPATFTPWDIQWYIQEHQLEIAAKETEYRSPGYAERSVCAWYYRPKDEIYVSYAENQEDLWWAEEWIHEWSMYVNAHNLVTGEYRPAMFELETVVPERRANLHLMLIDKEQIDRSYRIFMSMVDQLRPVPKQKE